MKTLAEKKNQAVTYEIIKHEGIYQTINIEFIKKDVSAKTLNEIQLQRGRVIVRCSTEGGRICWDNSGQSGCILAAVRRCLGSGGTAVINQQ